MELKEIKGDLKQALELVWRVFLEYEAPFYTKQGIDTFHSFISDKDKMNLLTFYGMYNKNKLIGVIATRNNGNHIALFFVDGEYHKKGIGKCLFQKVLENATSNEITVNSSVYAIEVYHKLGFVDTDKEQIEDGIIYTPMKLYINTKEK